MARATLPDSGIDWSAFEDDYNLIRDKIEAVFPDLFRDFNQRIRQPGGFHLTNPPRDRVWKTPNGRANFIVFDGVDEDPPVNHAAMLRLATLRSHDQYNTTIYSLDDRYRGVFGGRMVVFMNAADMQERDIAPETLVEIESLADDRQKRMVRGFKARPYDIPQGSIGAYYPETQSAVAVGLSRREEQDASSEVDPRRGQAAAGSRNAGSRIRCDPRIVSSQLVRRSLECSSVRLGHSSPPRSSSQSATMAPRPQATRHVRVPANLETPQVVQAGAQHFRETCAACHGAPGVASSITGLSPAPPNLLAAHRRNDPADVFGKVENGITGTAMPAFRGNLSDRSIWEIAAFLHHSRGITADAFAALSAAKATAQGK